MSDLCRVIEPTNEIDKLLYEVNTNEFRSGYVEVGEEKICMPLAYKDIADEIENFEVKDTDVFLASHPKTGTTWTQEMMWLLMNELNYEKAKENLLDRFPFLEFKCIFDYSEINKKYPDFKPPLSIADSINFTKNFKSPRLIKTHLPWCLLPKALREGTTKAKIVYIARNPKDTCVSFYHHARIIESFSGSFEDFCKLFLAGRLNYGPFWKNVLGYWERRYDSNLLFITYEEMKKDIVSVIKTMSDFLIHFQYKSHEIRELAEHLSFENMKKNPSVNYETSLSANNKFIKNPEQGGKFMRSGTVGSYKKEMTPEMEETFDKWSEKEMNGVRVKFEM